jgi:hypothetical protein
MRKTALCAALVATGVFSQGCATVRIGAVAGEAASQIDASTPAQSLLRDSSKAFTDHAIAVGWTEPAGDEDATQQALDVLIHGRGKTVAPASHPADAFIRLRAYDVAQPGAVAASLQTEIRQARVAVRAVNTAAATVVLGPERTAPSRRDDVTAAEAVVRAAHRTRMVFHDVRDALAPRLDDAGRATVDRELAAFDVELEHLSQAADALSLARPDVKLEQVQAIKANPGVG